MVFPFFYTLFFLSLFSSTPYIIHARTYPKTSRKVNNRSYKLHDLERFLDASKGSQISGISEIKKYFRRFGYLRRTVEDSDASSFDDIFDSDLERAITSYQAKLGLSVNGNLDNDTLPEIMKPRCGVRDTALQTSGMVMWENYVYFAGQPRWARSIPMTLTYAISPESLTNTNLTMPEVKSALKRAFSHWASVIPVTFIETDDYGFADIKIAFYKGDHGDGEPFDGELGVLAHAFSPESGRLHLDGAETWAVDFGVEKAKNAVDLESVATHEIGHVLGLAHTSVKEAVMYPSLKPRQRKLELKGDDIKGVQKLYGSNPNFSYQALSESDTSSNGGTGLRIKYSEIWFTWGILGMLLFCM